jgi:hypothetical protein
VRSECYHLLRQLGPRPLGQPHKSRFASETALEIVLLLAEQGATAAAKISGYLRCLVLTRIATRSIEVAST